MMFSVDEEDCRVDIYSNEAGCCVVVTHMPTGIRVTCDDSRSQLQNKRKAYRELAGLIAHRYGRG